MRAAAALIVAALAATAAPASDLCGDGAENTTVQWRASGAPYGPYSDWSRTVLPCGNGPQDSVRVDDDAAGFRWVEHVSGPPACIFTASQAPPQRQHGERRLTHVGGGRDCDGATRNGSCGFYMRGWLVFGVSGSSCAAMEIPTCSGWCW